MTTRTLTLLSLIAGGIIVLSNPAAVTAGSCFGSSSCPGASYNPEVVISATPQAITAGEGTYVRFENPPGVDQCSANFPYTEIPFAYTSADFSSWTNAGGYLNDYPTATKTYTVTCRKVIESGYGVSTASVTVTVTPAPAVDLAAGSVSPSSATADTPVTLSSTISNVGVAATPSGFTSLFQRATDSSGSGATDIGTYSYPTVLAASGSFSATRSYTFTSAGTWYVRACADKSSMGDTGTITESTEGNNCSPWSAITVAAAPVPPPAVPVATLTNNGPISIGGSATLTYGCTNSTSASISSIGAVTPVAGGTRSTGALAATTNYDLTCTGPGGTRNAATIVLVGNPIAYIMATPDRVNSGATTLLSFSAANLTPSASCSVTGPSGTLWTGASSALGALATTTSTSPAITKQSTFVISCDGASNLDNVIVNLVPRFEEF